MQATYQVPESNLEVLKMRLSKIARRCQRIKVQPPVLTVTGHKDVEYTYHEEQREALLKQIFSDNGDEIEFTN